MRKVVSLKPSLAGAARSLGEGFAGFSVPAGGTTSFATCARRVQQSARGLPPATRRHTALPSIRPRQMARSPHATLVALADISTSSMMHPAPVSQRDTAQ